MYYKYYLWLKVEKLEQIQASGKQNNTNQTDNIFIALENFTTLCYSH